MKNKPTVLYGYALLINLLPCISLSDANDQILKKFIISSWGNGAPILEIMLPQCWAYELQKGPDFDVHWFTDQKIKETMGIYIDPHPNIKKATDAKHFRRNAGNIEAEYYSENRGGKYLRNLSSRDFSKNILARVLLKLSFT